MGKILWSAHACVLKVQKATLFPLARSLSHCLSNSDTFLKYSWSTSSSDMCGSSLTSPLGALVLAVVVAWSGDRAKGFRSTTTALLFSAEGASTVCCFSNAAWTHLCAWFIKQWKKWDEWRCQLKAGLLYLLIVYCVPSWYVPILSLRSFSLSHSSSALIIKACSALLIKACAWQTNRCAYAKMINTWLWTCYMCHSGQNKHGDIPWPSPESWIRCL